MPPPGSSLALASGILCLLTWWLPPVAGMIGLFGAFQIWRVRRSIRKYPETYSGYGITVAAGVLLWMGCLGALMITLIAGAAQSAPVATNVLRW